ncbi:hypothetical protein LU293_07130 [Moraxella nasovis]|uniref:hypothetical protein n=1 Tax=Moraxella nasovis TaxID=2904121 RepID=UPI001F6258EA|nr:hypothetical protein [Moraxella nasovis]UNU72863.1 hypothetical protein LU293_07130 [Moraxella nasovis]
MTNHFKQSSVYFRRQAFYWFVMAVVILVAWLILWLMSATPSTATPTAETQVTSQDFTLPERIDSLDELSKDVKPIELSSLVRDLRNYPIEFKDKRYFEKIKNKYVIEVMNVSKNEVVADYLNGRKDRDDFVYFRYLDEQKTPRYLLVYGKFDDKNAAKAKLTSNDFKLPKSVTLSVQPVSRYLDIIDDYQLDDVLDYAKSTKRQVTLKQTRQEIPIEVPEDLEIPSNTELDLPITSVIEDVATQAKPKEDKPKPTTSPEKTKDKPNAEAAKPENPTAPTEEKSKPVIEPNTNTPSVPGSHSRFG